MTDYNAIVTQADPGWSIYVPEVDRHTYAAHLREVEPIACDLVQVMTDVPLEKIAVTVHLPADLADAIKAMHRARESVTAAEHTAREAQRAAATALRNAGAPLRDIAAALNLSHQRVHQVLEEVDLRRRELDQFRHDVDLNLAHGSLADFDLPVTDNDGNAPLIVALADEPVSKLTDRIRAAGGNANVFAKDGSFVHFVSVIDAQCEISEADETMVGHEAPSPNATIGMLLAYVERKPNGVTISATLGQPAYARDARQVELTSA